MNIFRLSTVQIWWPHLVFAITLYKRTLFPDKMRANDVTWTQNGDSWKLKQWNRPISTYNISCVFFIFYFFNSWFDMSVVSLEGHRLISSWNYQVSLFLTDDVSLFKFCREWLRNVHVSRCQTHERGLCFTNTSLSSSFCRSCCRRRSDCFLTLRVSSTWLSLPGTI